uniref:Alpha-amylase n=1 Tax=Sinonovacula constricta TaxID=98310 RepID=A0A1P8DWW5_SINCO|nr:alpha-amylase [Sinonovacula constricta]
MMILELLLLFVCGVQAEYTDPHCDGKQTIVHLFEWKWADIALECERFLSKKGFCGVQVSPANEHIYKDSAPWWQRYQPISYKLQSRSGTEAEFVDMVNRCRAVGVRIYVDVVVNHMAGLGQSGVGSAGSNFNSDNYDFPGVPFTREHFHPHCEIKNYGDPNEVRNCYLVALTDLDQHNDYVRDKIAEFLNHLIDLGVAGFRVDAAKHMWPADISAIQQRLKDLPEGGRPMFYHEVIDQGGEPIKTQEYTGLGYVTEFRYSIKIGQAVQNFDQLGNVVDFGWGMTDSGHAFVFVDNHDNQRGHGGGGSIMTFKRPREYRMATAYLLANDYGFTRVMSSYDFHSSDQGPPSSGGQNIKDVTINGDGSCGNGWICEHRWPSIGNMVAFRNAVAGTSKQNFYLQNNEVAFSRGNKGFFAMAKNGHMDKTLQTGLPAGDYCNLITECRTKVTVDGSGNAHIVINDPNEPVLAIIVGGPSTGGGGSSTGGTSGGSVTQAPQQPVGTAPPAPAGWSRTVIMIEKQTQPGQDLFIRGGLDHNRHSGCTQDASSSQCAIPMRDNAVGTGAHYEKYNAWRVNDNFLDWYGAEAGQGNYQGAMAQGTPAVWTTNRPGGGHNDLNKYGDHYWLVDSDMDCSRTDNGWFEIKAVVNGQWEGDIPSPATCTGTGSGAVPATSSNHWARCGMMNVFHFSSNTCEINPIP